MAAVTISRERQLVLLAVLYHALEGNSQLWEELPAEAREEAWRLKSELEEALDNARDLNDGRTIDATRVAKGAP